ncbi:MAG: hypothetical protein AAFX39_08560 [Pseudomonadota bacterium]
MRLLLVRAMHRAWLRRNCADTDWVGRDLRLRFGLTPAEAALALALRSGLSVVGHARDQDVSRNTAYTHYARLKEKLGCRRQADLIGRLSGLYGVPDV